VTWNGGEKKVALQARFLAPVADHPPDNSMWLSIADGSRRKSCARVLSGEQIVAACR